LLRKKENNYWMFVGESVDTQQTLTVFDTIQRVVKRKDLDTISSMDSDIMVIRNRECLLVCVSGVLGSLERNLSGFEWVFVGKSVV